MININSYCTKTRYELFFLAQCGDKYQQILYENEAIWQSLAFMSGDKYQQLLYENFLAQYLAYFCASDKYQQILYENS